MNGTGQKTEKATPRRLEKAKKDGSFAVSKELTGAVQFGAFVVLSASFAPDAFASFAVFVRSMLSMAFDSGLSNTGLRAIVALMFRQSLFPVLFCVSATAACGLAIQLFCTGFGFAPTKLTPDISRWNPMRRLRDTPRQNMTAATQALLLTPILMFAAYRLVSGNVETYLALPRTDPRLAFLMLAVSWKSFLLKAALAVVAIGCVDFFRQRRRFLRELRMSKQELRDESRESEGNPQVKNRIRRLQRDLARRNMMKEIPLATAIVVNPTHYAVALRYDNQAMAAPRVVAKGKNYLALRIRLIGVGNQVPIIENPPLAQALYKSVDVGQEIPAHLYRAVAEVLAYIFRVMHQAERPR